LFPENTLSARPTPLLRGARERRLKRILAMTALFTLLPDAVGFGDSKSAVLDCLADRFAAVYGSIALLCLSAFWNAKIWEVPDLGAGWPFPMPVSRWSRPVAVFLRLSAPVAFEAADDMPVELVFGLLSPEAARCICMPWPRFRA
jgi:PTS system nitrogen regulatory IIA component